MLQCGLLPVVCTKGKRTSGVKLKGERSGAALVLRANSSSSAVISRLLPSLTCPLLSGGPTHGQSSAGDVCNAGDNGSTVKLYPQCRVLIDPFPLWRFMNFLCLKSSQTEALSSLLEREFAGVVTSASPYAL